MSLATDNPQAFPVLEDPTTKTGVALAKVLEDDAAAGKNALPALVGKDPAGNLRYLKPNTAGELVVDTDSEEVACLSGSAKVSGNNTTEQDVISITLQNSVEYKKIGWIVSCFRQAEYRIVHIDDEGGVGEAENELATMLVGPGDYTDSGELDCLNFTSGATGDQVIKIVGLNKDAASDLRATLSLLEMQ